MSTALFPRTPIEDQHMRLAFESLHHDVKKHGYNWALNDEATCKCLLIMARETIKKQGVVHE